MPSLPRCWGLPLAFLTAVLLVAAEPTDTGGAPHGGCPASHPVLTTDTPVKFCFNAKSAVGEGSTPTQDGRCEEWCLLSDFEAENPGGHLDRCTGNVCAATTWRDWLVATASAIPVVGPYVPVAVTGLGWFCWAACTLIPITALYDYAGMDLPNPEKTKLRGSPLLLVVCWLFYECACTIAPAATGPGTLLCNLMLGGRLVWSAYCLSVLIGTEPSAHARAVFVLHVAIYGSALTRHVWWQSAVVVWDGLDNEVQTAVIGVCVMLGMVAIVKNNEDEKRTAAEAANSGAVGAAAPPSAPRTQSDLATAARPTAQQQPRRWDFFISHTQRNPEAKLAASELYHSLAALGFAVWLDVKMDDRSQAAMEHGVRNSRCVIAVITKGPTPECDYFNRPLCLQELRWANDAGIRIQPVNNIDDKSRIGEFMDGAPHDLQHLREIDFRDLYRGSAAFWKTSVDEVVRASGSMPAHGR